MAWGKLHFSPCNSLWHAMHTVSFIWDIFDWTPYALARHIILLELCPLKRILRARCPLAHPSPFFVDPSCSTTTVIVAAEVTAVVDGEAAVGGCGCCCCLIILSSSFLASLCGMSQIVLSAMPHWQGQPEQSRHSTSKFLQLCIINCTYTRL